MVLTFDKNGHGIDWHSRDAAIWRMGASWIIDFKDSPKDILHSLHALSSAQAIVCQELNAPEADWMNLRQHDLALSTLKLPFLLGLHIAGLADWMQPKDSERPIPALRQTYEEITALLNVEFHLALALRLEGAIQAVCDQLRVDSTIEYTLEATCEEYLAEIKSDLLKRRLIKIEVLKAELFRNPEDAKIEKELMQTRSEIRSNMQDLKNAIGKSLNAMNELSRASVKQAGQLEKPSQLLFLLLKIMDDSGLMPWGHKQMAFHLMLSRLEVLSVQIGSLEDEKIKWSIALKNALFEFLKEEPADSLFASLKHPEKDLPKLLKVKIKEWLRKLEILPEESYRNCNPDLKKLIE